jgi:hypothetical protein
MTMDTKMNAPHNEIPKDTAFGFALRYPDGLPKDTVEELAKKIMADNGGIDEVDDPKMFRDICTALTTAYNKGVEVGIQQIVVAEKRPHEHNYIPRVYEGSWAASVPPPSMFCTKCGLWN